MNGGREWHRALWRFQGYRLGSLGLIAAALFALAAEGDALLLGTGATLALGSVLVIVRSRRQK